MPPRISMNALMNHLLANAAQYPRSVASVTNPNATYKPAVLAAMREFRAAKPWRGSIAERKEKFLALHAKLCAVYGITSALSFQIGDTETETETGNGCCRMDTRAITLIGKLSVVTYLHEFAHAVYGRSERKACEWSVNLYKRIFPKSAARMGTNGHMIVARVSRQTTAHPRRASGGAFQDGAV